MCLSCGGVGGIFWGCVGGQGLGCYVYVCCESGLFV